MRFLTLADIKAQARIDHDYEDALLTRYGNAAERKIFSDTGYTYEQLLARGDDGEFPPELVQAGLMLATEWYKHRTPTENVQMYAVAYSYENLISDYVKHTFDNDDESE